LLKKKRKDYINDEVSQRLNDKLRYVFCILSADCFRLRLLKAHSTDQER